MRRRYVDYAPYSATFDEDVEDNLEQESSSTTTRRWIYLHASWILFRLCLCVGALLPIGFVYVFSVHRIQTLSDALKMMSVMQLPLEDDRCRRFNSSHFHCLPNVLFIGASKCGTTSVTDYLAAHPRVRFVNRRLTSMDNHREVHRFDRNTFGWSINTIDLADEWASTPLIDDQSMPVIHYTPHYLYAPTVPFEIKNFYPKSSKMKFIIMLREPVKRAVSSYWFQMSHIFHGIDTGSMEEFEKIAVQEIRQRRTYEKCIEAYLGQKSQHVGINQSTVYNTSNVITTHRPAALAALRTNVPPPQQQPLHTPQRSRDQAVTSSVRKKSTSQRRLAEKSTSTQRNPETRFLGVRRNDTNGLQSANHSRLAAAVVGVASKSPAAMSRPSSTNQLDKKNNGSTGISNGLHPPGDSTENYRAAIYSCFGDELRSSKLGGRHIDKGVYVDQLQRWLLNFPNRENYHIITLEQWAADPAGEYKKLLQFIGAEEKFIPLDAAADNQQQLPQGALRTLELHRGTSPPTSGNDGKGLTGKNEGENMTKNSLSASLQTSATPSTASDSKTVPLPDFSKKRLVQPNGRGVGDKLPKTLEATLTDFYRPYNAQLEQLLGIRLGYPT